MLSGKTKYFLAAIGQAVIWGFFSIPLRSLKAYPAEQILYYRIFASLIITWLIILLFRRDKLRADVQFYREQTAEQKARLTRIILLAGLLITGNWFTYIYAVNHVSLSSGAFAYMVCPLITALGGFFILNEKLSRAKFAALGIAFISILILARGSLTDVLWSVLIASLYAFYLIVQRTITGIDKLNMLGIQLIISAILMLPLYVYHFHVFPSEMRFWLVIITISAVFTIIPLFLSLYALIGMPSSTLGVIIYINPVVAFTVAFFYFHEPITFNQLFAYLLLLVAVIVFNWAVIREILYRKRVGRSHPV